MNQPAPHAGFYMDGEPHVDPALLVAHYCKQQGTLSLIPAFARPGGKTTVTDANIRRCAAQTRRARRRGRVTASFSGAH
jgi:hypothetical protein